MSKYNPTFRTNATLFIWLKVHGLELPGHKPKVTILSEVKSMCCNILSKSFLLIESYSYTHKTPERSYSKCCMHVYALERTGETYRMMTMMVFWRLAIDHWTGHVACRRGICAIPLYEFTQDFR